ncbi:CCAAT enhancer-binding zeta, partial [Brachionus plicatilis]
MEIKLIVEPGKKWYEHKFKKEPENFEPIKDLEKVHLFHREKTNKSDQNWIKTVLQNGTIGDKISANSLLIQESALHNLSGVESLIQSVKLSKKRECMLAIDALKDIFGNFLLPKRALHSFHEHPFEYLNSLNDDKTLREKRLVLWYFESLLKVKYSNFLKALQLVFQDTLATTKFKVSSVLTDLLIINHNEQQKVILDSVVNKLGDPDHQVSSRIIYQIKNLLKKCPKMKKDVLIEIERLVSRQNISSRAQYYGFCCMNQMILQKQDLEVANRLLIIYFSFFKKFVKNKEVDSRMLSALLTGVNRAYKYAKMDSQEIDNNLNTLFKLVHITPFSVSMQALALLNQVVESREDLVNRYYNALYRKMFDLECKNTSKQTFFLNLIFNSLIKDEALPRLKAFVKRLLQICLNQSPPFICGSFILISELIKSKKSIIQLDHSALIRNSIDNGVDIKFNDDDDEERFVDVKDESDKEDITEANGESEEKKNNSWIHKKNIVFKKHDKYDYHERNPLYSGADKTLTYELLLYSKHYHPTVVVYANKLMNGESVEYDGDPMEDFTLIHFLDRFVFKNPKRSKDNKKTKKSVFQPNRSIQKSAIKGMAVNSKEYLKLDPSKIPEDEKIFYNYHKAQESKKNPADHQIVSDAESVSDSEFDAYLMKTEVDGADPNDNFTLDFADGLSKNKKKKKKQEVSSDSSDFDDDDLMEDFDDKEFENAMNEEDMDLDDIDDDIFIDKKPKKRSKEDLSNLFAAADEFTDLVNESARYDELGVGSISNKDRAD